MEEGCFLYTVVCMVMWIVSHKHIQEGECTILLYLHSEFYVGSD